MDRSEIPVVILAGGMGTRLSGGSDMVPKPLVQVGERPLLWHIMKYYRSFGFRRFVLCLGYKSWLIKEWFLTYREQLSDLTIPMGGGGLRYLDGPADEDWSVTCLETGLHTGTGGRLARVADHVGADRFMFTYGDGIGDVDLDALLRFHEDHRRIATVTGVHPTSRYGEIRVEDGIALEFNEKPTKATGRVSGGFFVMERRMFDYLDRDDPGLTLEYEPLQKLARDGELAVYPHDGYWIGMDTVRELTELNQLWERRQAPWKVWEG